MELDIKICNDFKETLEAAAEISIRLQMMAELTRFRNNPDVDIENLVNNSYDIINGLSSLYGVNANGICQQIRKEFDRKDDEGMDGVTRLAIRLQQQGIVNKFTLEG